MNLKRKSSFAIVALILVLIVSALPPSTQVALAANACATSTPPSGTYSVTVCFTTPASGSTLSGNVGVTVTVSTTGSSPGVRRVITKINGNRLLIDFLSPFTFTLPTAKWQDGAYTLSATALMKDNYTTANAANLPVTFNNGNAQPPVNRNTFTPSPGTTPPNGSPFIVAAAGDGADGATNATNVSDRIAAINPNLFLYLGDVYEDGTVAEFYNWYGTGSTSYSRFYSITNPTIGNHEYTGSSAAGYFDYWNNVPNYYSYNAGGWHFISLNSNSSRIGVNAGSPQYNWLAQDLAANSSMCTIVYYHHPLFNVGPEGPTTSMTDIWSLMAQNGVSIVLNGHDHDYQRWVPLNGSGQPSSSGITEFVAGGGGHGLQTIATTDSRVAFADSANPEAFGALKLALNATGASFAYINSSGVTLDSGVVPCAKAGPDNQAPSVPGGFTATAADATHVNLSWQASTDNVGVAGYTIYRNNSILTTVPGATLNNTDSTAQPSTTYSYAVDAYDGAGNHSAKSSPASVTTPAMPPSLSFAVGADTYVNSGSPTSNYGSATTWRVDGSPDLHAYLRFSVNGLAGFPIQRATLYVFASNNSSLGISAVAVSNNSWGETTTNYNNAPPLGAQIASSGAFTSGNWVGINVTPYVTGEGTYSFGITTTGTSSLSFASKESGANAAYLLIDLTAGDTTAPSVPSGLTATAVSSTQVNLAWQASTDNVGVTGYTIYRNNASLTTVSGTTLSYSDSTAQPNTTYSYTVDAFDAAGNHSAQSSPASATTPPGADTQAPSIPTGLTANATSSTQVNLAWQASTDNVGVTGYTIYRDSATLTTVSGATLSYSDTTVQPNTSYSYTVDAFDAAGNHSAQSSPASVTTPASGPGTLTINVGADTYVNSGSPTTNYGAATTWRTDGSPDVHAYLKFTVQGTAGHTIQRVYLKFYANSSNSLGVVAQAVADTSWGESAMTYNNAPSLGASINPSGAVAGGTWVTIDVTSYITGDGTFSFGITSPSATATSFASKESGLNAAQLIITIQ